jgi:hypothetical protein
MAFAVVKDTSRLVDDASRLKLEGEVMKWSTSNWAPWRGPRACAS